MAKAATIKAGKILVKLGNDATPVVFEAPCAFTDKAITWTKTGQDTEVPDCADPDASGWMETDITGRQVRIEGGGVLTSADKEVWRAAWNSDAPVLFRIEEQYAGGTVIHEGLLHVMEMAVTANRTGGRSELRITAQSDGPVTLVT